MRPNQQALERMHFDSATDAIAESVIVTKCTAYRTRQAGAVFIGAVNIRIHQVTELHAQLNLKILRDVYIDSNICDNYNRISRNYYNLEDFPQVPTIQRMYTKKHVL